MLLSIKNINTNQFFKKLDYKMISLFKVIQKKCFIKIIIFLNYENL